MKGVTFIIHHNIYHPTIPEEYQNETDYRKIPKEYLEKNIPKGRGMVKWQPFATMPQQYADLNTIIAKQSYEYMPILSSDQVIIINEKIHEYIASKKLCTIIFYDEIEFKKKSIKGVIKKIFDLEHYIVLNINQSNSLFRVNFKNIIDIY